MSDQTDIERIIENQLRDVDITYDTRDVRIRIAGAITEYAKLRDEETARLKEESKRRLDGWTQAEQDLKETADQLRARLAEAEVVSERRQKLAEGFAAEQLALESQCQRMRDALNLAVVYLRAGGIDDVADGADAALSDPLDLELLNRVRNNVEELQRRFRKWERGSYIHIAGDLGDDFYDIFDQLLKSLSPAP